MYSIQFIVITYRLYIAYSLSQYRVAMLYKAKKRGAKAPLLNSKRMETHGFV